MAYKDELIDKVVDAIHKCYHMDDNNINDSSKSVVNATKVLSVGNWPLSNVSKLKDFGSDNVLLAGNYYADRLKSIQQDFTPYRLYQNRLKWVTARRMVNWGVLFIDSLLCDGDKETRRKIAEFKWSDISLADFPQIMLLLDLLFTLPPTSVSCETSFSHMKLVETNRRVNLRHTTSDDLLQVKLVSEDISTYSPDEAVNQWLMDSTGGRRLSYKRLPLDQPAQDDVYLDDQDLDLNQENGASPEQEVSRDDTLAADFSDEEADEIENINTIFYNDSDSGYCSDYQDEEENSNKNYKISSSCLTKA